MAATLHVFEERLQMEGSPRKKKYNKRKAETQIQDTSAPTNLARGPEPVTPMPMVYIYLTSKVYWPKPLSSYREPELGDNMLDGVCMHQDFDKSLK